MALASILDENNVDITMWTKFEDEKENFPATDGMCHSGRAAGWLRFPWHR